mmetsp:Transcript_74027/g.222548  ORF Transcript_74027/g.222548 Transcript_74027/m.222548 type:complete len:237 (-) Transcript_74027:1333-2043(-)
MCSCSSASRSLPRLRPPTPPSPSLSSGCRAWRRTCCSSASSCRSCRCPSMRRRPSPSTPWPTSRRAAWARAPTSCWCPPTSPPSPRKLSEACSASTRAASRASRRAARSRASASTRRARATTRRARPRRRTAIRWRRRARRMVTPRVASRWTWRRTRQIRRRRRRRATAETMRTASCSAKTSRMLSSTSPSAPRNGTTPIAAVPRCSRSHPRRARRPSPCCVSTLALSCRCDQGSD